MTNSFSINDTALAAHEFYTDLMKAGFSSEQALEIVKALMQATAGKK